MLNKPSVARGKVVFVSEKETNIYKVVSGGPCELVSINVTAGNAACVFRLLDLANYTNNYSLESGPAFAAEASNSYSPHLNQPMPFKNGLIIVCEQGIGANAECVVTVN